MQVYERILSSGDSVNLTTQQRTEHILSQVLSHGHVTVRALATQLSVSEATVRRDLRLLADDRQIELVHGGATPPRNSDFSFRSKAMRNVQAKRVVGQLAAELLNDNDHIFLDSGTTCFAMAPFVKIRRNLTVIVNSVRLIEELADAPNLNVIVLGGRYRSDRMDNIGPLTTSMLDQLRGYIAFVGADGLSMDFGPTAGDVESADLYRLAVKNARDVIVVVDHSKFMTPSLYKIVDWDRISTVVTDQTPADEWLAFFNARNIEVITPPADAVVGGADQESASHEAMDSKQE